MKLTLMKIIGNISGSSLVHGIAESLKAEAIDVNNKTYTFGEDRALSSFVDGAGVLVIESRIDAANTVIDMLNYSKLINPSQSILILTYLPYMRQAVGNNSLLDDVVKLINGLEFKKVILIDVHDVRILEHINNSVEITHYDIFHHMFNKQNLVLGPDNGANRRCEQYKNSGYEIDCVEKVRDENGVHHKYKNITNSKPIVIIDDVVDSGSTLRSILNSISSKVIICITHSLISEANFRALSSVENIEGMYIAMDHVNNDVVKSSKKVEFINVSGIIARKLFQII